MNRIKRIFVFGDSIGQGFYDEENGGWVQKLQRDYFKESIEGKSDINVINLSVSGHTSNEVLQRIESEISSRKRPEGMLTILAIGVNDSYKKNGIKRTHIEKFEQNIDDIISEVKALGSELLILGCTPCIDGRVQPTGWDSILYYDSQELKKYEGVLEGCAKRANVDFLPLWDVLYSHLSEQELMPDGIHPNPAGHEIIYNEVSKKLKTILENKV